MIQTPSFRPSGSLSITPAFGQPADKALLLYARKDMAQSFGDVSFSLAVNEIGLAEYDESRSKYGWHIIKRLK